MIEHMDERYNAVFSIVRSALFGYELNDADRIDYAFVYQEMKDQTILPLTTGLYKALPMGQELMSKWMSSLLFQIANGARVQYVEQKLTALFDENGIQSSILKGSSAAMYYHGSAMRTFGDVDIIVAPQDFERAAELLSNSGYEQKTGLYDDYRNVTFTVDKVIVELHRHFFDDLNIKYDSLIYDALPQCRKITVSGCQINVLPDLENGLVLLQHIRQHIVGQLGFRQIIDWLMFVDKVCDDTFWNEMFREKAKEIGLEKLAITTTALGKKYFGLPDRISWCDSAEEEAVEAMLAFLIKSGNFGVKQQDNRHIVLNIMSRNRTLLGRLRNLQHTGETNWELLKTHPKLKGFAWLYQIIRYIYRGIKSGEVFSFIHNKQWKEARQKKRLYSLIGIE